MLCAEAPAFRPCEASDLFTTAKLACRTGEQARLKRYGDLAIAAARRLTTKLQPFGWRGFEPRVSRVAGEVTDLFTTGWATRIQGNERRRHRVDLQSKYPASSPPGIQNSPSFPHDKGFGEAGNKNPSGAWLGGVRTIELKNGLSPFHLHEKARARRHRLERMAQIRSAASDYKARCFSSAFSVSRAPIAREGRGV